MRSTVFSPNAIRVLPRTSRSPTARSRPSRVPAAFPAGQGRGVPGLVVEVGSGVTGFTPGDEVMGWSDSRSAQADYVISDRQHLIAKPRALDWIRAGALWAIGVTSISAVRAVAVRPGEVVAVSAAAGGVGGLAAQLSRSAGARVLGIASAANAGRLRGTGERKSVG